MSEGKIKVYDRRLSNREIADVLQLSPERQRERDRLIDEQNLLKQCLSAMPVGYIPTHTAENLPEMIGDLAKALAEETTEREKLESELAAERALADRLVKVVEYSAKIIGPPDGDHDSRWVTDDELDDLWDRTQSALAAVKGGPQ